MFAHEHMKLWLFLFQYGHECLLHSTHFKLCDLWRYVIYEGMPTCSVTMEQYYSIKLHVKLQKSASGSMNMLKTVWGDEFLL